MDRENYQYIEVLHIVRKKKGLVTIKCRKFQYLGYIM